VLSSPVALHSAQQRRTGLPPSLFRASPVTVPEGRLPWTLGGHFSPFPPPCSCYTCSARALGCRPCEDHAACAWTRHRCSALGSSDYEASAVRYGARRRGHGASARTAGLACHPTRRARDSPQGRQDREHGKPQPAAVSQRGSDSVHGRRRAAARRTSPCARRAQGQVVQGTL
jgi:hypothetical protein